MFILDESRCSHVRSISCNSRTRLSRRFPKSWSIRDWQLWKHQVFSICPCERSEEMNKGRNGWVLGARTCDGNRTGSEFFAGSQNPNRSDFVVNESRFVLQQTLFIKLELIIIKKKNKQHAREKLRENFDPRATMARKRRWRRTRWSQRQLLIQERIRR